jgi:hypothetical protein
MDENIFDKLFLIPDSVAPTKHVYYHCVKEEKSDGYECRLAVTNIQKLIPVPRDKYATKDMDHAFLEKVFNAPVKIVK